MSYRLIFVPTRGATGGEAESDSAIFLCLHLDEHEHLTGWEYYQAWRTSRTITRARGRDVSWTSEFWQAFGRQSCTELRTNTQLPHPLQRVNIVAKALHKAPMVHDHTCERRHLCLPCVITPAGAQKIETRHRHLLRDLTRSAVLATQMAGTKLSETLAKIDPDALPEPDELRLEHIANTQRMQESMRTVLTLMEARAGLHHLSTLIKTQKKDHE